MTMEQLTTENPNEAGKLLTTACNLILANHACILYPGQQGDAIISEELRNYTSHLESRNVLSLTPGDVFVTLEAVSIDFLDYMSQVMGFKINHVQLNSFDEIFSSEFRSQHPNFVLDPYTQDTYLAKLAVQNNIQFRYTNVDDLIAGAGVRANDKGEFERICRELNIETIPNKTIIGIESLWEKMDVLEEYLLTFGSCFICNNRSAGGMGNEVISIKEVSIDGQLSPYFTVFGKGLGINSEEQGLSFQTFSDLQSFLKNILENTFTKDKKLNKESFFGQWLDSGCTEVILAPRYNIQEGPSVYFEIHAPKAGESKPFVEILGTFGQVLNPKDNNACVGMQYPNPASQYDERMISEATRYAEYLYQETKFCGRGNIDYAIIINDDGTVHFVAVESNGRKTAVQPGVESSAITGTKQEFDLVDHLSVPGGYSVSEIMKYLKNKEIELLGKGLEQNSSFGACPTTQINPTTNQMAMMYVGEGAKPKMAKIQQLLYNLPNKNA